MITRGLEAAWFDPVRHAEWDADLAGNPLPPRLWILREGDKGPLYAANLFGRNHPLAKTEPLVRAPEGGQLTVLSVNEIFYPAGRIYLIREAIPWRDGLKAAFQALARRTVNWPQVQVAESLRPPLRKGELCA